MYITRFYVASLISSVGIALFQLFGSPSPAIIGESFEVTCITTEVFLEISKGVQTIVIITGDYSNGTCKTANINQNFTYHCSSSNYTYKVLIPGRFNDVDDNGTIWICQSPFGGAGHATLKHLLTYPDVEVKMKPVTPVLVKEKTAVSFYCYVPIRESWQGTEIIDSLLGKVVHFIRDGDNCTTAGSILQSYNISCNLSGGIFSVELKTTLSWYDGQDITCRSQYGNGRKATDKFFEGSVTITLSERNKLEITPSAVDYGTDVSITLSCQMNEHVTEIIWYMNATVFINAVSSEGDGKCNSLSEMDGSFEIRCYPDNRLFELMIQSRFLTYGIGNALWTCGTSGGTSSNAESYNITGIPEILAIGQTDCIASENVNLMCNLSSPFKDLVKQAVWYHQIDDQLVRILNGTWNKLSFQLRIPFCSIHDTGTYICSVKTDIPNLERMSNSITFSVSGPPLFVDKSVIRAGKTFNLIVQFYSNPSAEEPVWRYKNETISSGTKYSKKTSVDQVKAMFHDRIVTLNGFTSTLRIFEYDKKDDGIYTIIVRNSILPVSETIILDASDTLDNQEHKDAGYSGGTLGAVAAGCIIGTMILVLASLHVIKRLRVSGKENANSKDGTIPDDQYDELGMRSLPSVYDTVQQP